MKNIARIKLASAPRRPVSQAVIAGQDGRNIHVNVADDESALTWLFRRKGPDGQPLISAGQYAAGEKLRLDYTAGQLGQRVTACWDPTVTSGARGQSQSSPHLEPTERMIAAKQRFHAALDAVGPELSGILWEVCCLSAGVEQAERRLALPQRSGKAILSLALTRLARHYGYEPPPGGGARAPLRHWGMADYRPEIA